MGSAGQLGRTGAAPDLSSLLPQVENANANSTRITGKRGSWQGRERSGAPSQRLAWVEIEGEKNSATMSPRFTPQNLSTEPQNSWTPLVPGKVQFF